MRLLNLVVPRSETEKRDTGWERWRESERASEREKRRVRRTRKKGGAGGKRAGRHLRGVGGRVGSGWRSGDGHPRVQCRIKRMPGPAEIDASRGSSLIYAFITVNNASPFASGLSLSLSVSLFLSFARQSTPFHLVCPIHRARLSFDTGIRVHFRE